MVKFPGYPTIGKKIVADWCAKYAIFPTLASMHHFAALAYEIDEAINQANVGGGDALCYCRTEFIS